MTIEVEGHTVAKSGPKSVALTVNTRQLNRTLGVIDFAAYDLVQMLALTEYDAAWVIELLAHWREVHAIQSKLADTNTKTETES